MIHIAHPIRWPFALALAAGLAACGGGGGGDPPANQAPIPGISSPAEGALFSGGETLTVAVSATDSEDGPLAGARLTWWAELHHDTHTHPFQPETTGSGGTVTIPSRGETSDNVFYRFHLRATDSSGASAEVTRDVLPRKARVTLATLPAGLGLTLDGTPVVGPFTFTGVAGMERDLGAADQTLNGRRYRFAIWSDGGTAAHTLVTPGSDSTLTATFTDLGPATNQPPTVSLIAPATANQGSVVTLSANAADGDGSVVKVSFHEGATLLGETTTAPFRFDWTPATVGTRSLTARATDNAGATSVSAAVVVTVSRSSTDTVPPIATLIAPAAFASGLSGVVSLSASATDDVAVTGVEFQIDGVAIGSADTTVPYGASVDSSAHASGQQVLRARATDSAGNVSAWSAVTVEFGGGRTQPAGFTRDETWITGLSAATAFAQAPDGRLFVAEQGGALRVVKGGTLLAAPFLSVSVDDQGERGLLGVAFHPDFAGNGYVYVYYTTTEGGTHNRISRFTASGDVAVPASELKLVDLPALSGATNHNGGALHFGADGKLYVGVGDNAKGALSPDLGSPFGKMLRFNDDGTIPADNPYYATQSGIARAIWARGLRNPFTFAVRPSDGRIHINDVGLSTWEEVNLGAPGADYGWPATEGPTSAAGVAAPLFAYKHSAASPPGSGPGGFFVGAAIAGGAFYPPAGPFPPPWRGSYFFADYASRAVGALDLANGNAAYAFGSVSSGRPVGLLASSDGALLVLTRDGIVRFSTP